MSFHQYQKSNDYVRPCVISIPCIKRHPAADAMARVDGYFKFSIRSSSHYHTAEKYSLLIGPAIHINERLDRTGKGSAK